MSSTFFKRINFGLILSLILLFGCQSSYEQKLRELQSQKPNIILCMADDLGWGDPGFNGNQIIKTPQLDDMASEGLVFNRFYSSSPVCSPTRGSCLTGRHPYRYGIFGANTGHLPRVYLLPASSQVPGSLHPPASGRNSGSFHR